MSDLISRQAAIDAIFKVGHEHIMENVLPIGAVLDYSEAIKALPTVDAVEVVRCRDCKFSKDTGDYQDTYQCTSRTHAQDYLVHSLDFCSYGVREDEPQSECPCETCANNGNHDGECRDCVFESEVIRWKRPSHYKPKTEPQTERSE